MVGIEDVPEEDDGVGRGLEVVQVGVEVIDIMAEPVGAVLSTQMEIRANGQLHHVSRGDPSIVGNEAEKTTLPFLHCVHGHLQR